MTRACLAGLLLVSLGCTGVQKQSMQGRSLLSYAPGARRAYILDVDKLAKQPEILAIFPGEVFGLVFSSIEEEHPGSLRGSKLAVVVYTEEEGAFSIWVFKDAAPLTEKLEKEADIEEINGTTVYVIKDFTSVWHFLPEKNVLVMGEKRSALEKALAVVGKMPLKRAEFSGFLRGDNAFSGEVHVHSEEEVAPPNRYEGHWMIIRPVVEKLGAKRFDFSMSADADEATLRVGFPEKTVSQVKKALQNCKCSQTLKLLLLSATVTKEGESTVVIIKSTVEKLVDLVEHLYEEQDETGTPELAAPRRALPPEALRSPPPMPKTEKNR